MNLSPRRLISPLAAISPGVPLALLLLLFQFGINLSGGYGYFRDEFYYIACSDHLAWGYVDHPPLSIVILWLNRIFLGDSVFALRLLPAAAVAGLVYLTGLVVRELGGGRFAQFIACVAVVFAPVYLAVSSFYSMNVFEPLFWIGSAYVLIRILNTGNEKGWLLFGAIAGLGLQNKLGMLFFGLALVVGLAITSQRKQMASKWFWMGGLVALILFSPNLLWQATHDWATVEFMRNAQQWKNAPLSLLEFLSAQILFQHPIALPLWLAGLSAFFLHNNLEKYRFFGIAYIVLLVLFVMQRGKPYYLSPVYPLLLSAGAVVFEDLAKRKNRSVFVRLYVGMLLAGGLITLPLWVPILSVETYVRYSNHLGLQPPRMERHRDTMLPQVFADRFGWKEMVAEVARAYHSLTPEEQSEATIYTQNYGEAGAIDFFGGRYNLPKAISGHNNYWLWGMRNPSATTVIIVGGKREDHDEVFGSVQLFTIHNHQYAMPFETDLPVYICRKPRIPLKDIWEKVRRFI
jgi:hypothetical protein